MPFWSRGNDKSNNTSETSLSDDFSSDSTTTSFGSPYSLGSDNDDALSSMASSLGDMQQFSIALRQQIMVQTVINTLTDKAFEKCITGKPSSDGLSGKDVACVNATVCKWLDTNEFINGRLAREMGAGAGGM